MNKNVQKVLIALMVFSLSLLIFSGCSTKVKAQEARGVVTIAFDDGSQNQYSNAYPLMKARGLVGTFYVISDVIGENNTMTVAELQDLQANGNEIGSHSKSHPAFTSLTEQQIHDECNASKQTLQSYGLTVNNFAYPYGDRNNYTDSITSQYYRSIRSAYVEPFIMSLPTSQVLLTGYPGETGDPVIWSQLDALQAAEYEVDQVASNGGWVIIFFHNVVWGDYSDPYEIAAEYFRDFLDYVQASDVSVLTVNQALNIAGPSVTASINPTSANMNLGGSQLFTSNVTGGVSPYTYQWYLNNSAVTGGTNSSWTFNPTSIGTYKIYLHVDDSYAGSINTATSTVQVTLPLISTINPTLVNITIGTTQQFTSTTTGGLIPYTYQWCQNNTAVSGATSSTWAFNPNDTGNYRVYLNVTDTLNSKVQSNIVTDIVVNPLPIASISPIIVNMTTEDTQIFSPTISGGTQPYTYQWYRNNTAVATTANYTFTSSTAGTYKIYLNVTDYSGVTVKSNNATARVETPTIVTINPTHVKIDCGQSLTFSSSISGGTTPYFYQWYLNDTPVPGATESTWTFAPNASGHYKIFLIVTDGFNFRVQSNVVTDVLVCSTYLFLGVDSQISTLRGHSVTLTVNVFNQLDPELQSSLTLMVTGPSSYNCFDVQPIKVPAGTVGEYTFKWAVPNVAGTYIIEVGLAPASLTAYDAIWLNVK